MLTKLGLTLTTIGLFAASSASADFYTDEASWLAALPSGAQSSDTAQGTTATTTTTIQIRPDGSCCTIVGQTTTSVPSISRLVGNFSFSGDCAFLPGCQITNTTDITVTFSQPIIGFAADLELIGDDMGINGYADGIPNPEGYGGFYGMISQDPLTSLDFALFTEFTDNQDAIDLTFTAFAAPDPPDPVSEPPAIAALLGAIVILAGLHRNYTAKV